VKVQRVEGPDENDENYCKFVEFFHTKDHTKEQIQWVTTILINGGYAPKIEQYIGLNWRELAKGVDDGFFCKDAMRVLGKLLCDYARDNKDFYRFDFFTGLPNDMLVIILGFAWTYGCDLRLVNKKWNATLKTPTFTKLLPSLAIEDTRFVARLWAIYLAHHIHRKFMESTSMRITWDSKTECQECFGIDERKQEATVCVGYEETERCAVIVCDYVGDAKIIRRYVNFYKWEERDRRDYFWIRFPVLVSLFERVMERNTRLEYGSQTQHELWWFITPELDCENYGYLYDSYLASDHIKIIQSCLKEGPEKLDEAMEFIKEENARLGVGCLFS